MAIKNSWTLPPKREFPADVHLSTPADEYDVNFMFPVRELSTSKITVTPFVPSLHAQAYINSFNDEHTKATFEGFSRGPFDTLQEFLLYAEVVRSTPSSILFAVLDTSKEGEPQFAGVVNYWCASRRTLAIELGSVIIRVPYRRSHVTTQACGLLIAYALTPLSTSSSLLNNEGGLGLRRFQWTAYDYNEASLRTATRLGFKEEGVLRNWYEKPSDPTKGKRDNGRVDVQRGKEWEMEPVVDEGGQRTTRGFSEDSWMGSITSKDWDEGVEVRLTKEMAREK